MLVHIREKNYARERDHDKDKKICLSTREQIDEASLHDSPVSSSDSSPYFGLTVLGGPAETAKSLGL